MNVEEESRLEPSAASAAGKQFRDVQNEQGSQDDDEKQLPDIHCIAPLSQYSGLVYYYLQL
jgi:hypothetical protein